MWSSIVVICSSELNETTGRMGVVMQPLDHTIQLGSTAAQSIRSARVVTGDDQQGSMGTHDRASSFGTNAPTVKPTA